jgi:hypothetical protein
MGIVKYGRTRRVVHGHDAMRDWFGLVGKSQDHSSSIVDVEPEVAVVKRRLCMANSYFNSALIRHELTGHPC